MAEQSNKFDLLKDAGEYVESVMSSVTAIVRTPLTNVSGRKRQLSMPDESDSKKAKGDSAETRDMLKAKRSLYASGDAAGTNSAVEKRAVTKDTSNDSGSDKESNCTRSPTNDNANGDRGKGNRNNRRKQKKHNSKTEQLDFEVNTTTADVHIDADFDTSDITQLDTRDLVIKMFSKMEQNFNALDKRMGSLEVNLEKRLREVGKSDR